MFNKRQIATIYGGLLAVTLLISGCALYENFTGCCDVDDITWCNRKGEGRVKCMNDSMVLNDSKEKTEMWGNVASANLDCEFELKFDLDEIDEDDSSVGLETWDPHEHSITFRGGILKVVTAGATETESMKAVAESSYDGRRIKVLLRARSQQLSAVITTIDGDHIERLDWPNTWSEPHKLKPRLNADRDDTITLYSSSCSTK